MKQVDRSLLASVTLALVCLGQLPRLAVCRRVQPDHDNKGHPLEVFERNSFKRHGHAAQRNSFPHVPRSAPATAAAAAATDVSSGVSVGLQQLDASTLSDEVLLEALDTRAISRLRAAKEDAHQALGISVPLAIMAVFVAAIVLGGSYFHIGTTAERGFLFNMESLYMITYIAFIPESLQLARSLCGNAHFSGWLIAAPVPGDAILSVILWWCFQKDASVRVNRWAKTCVMGAMIVMFVVTLATAVVMWVHESCQLANRGHAWPAWVVLLLRFMLGFGSTNFICQQVFTIFTRPEERPTLNVQLFVACMIGLGLGPAIAGFSHYMLDDYMPYFAVVPAVLSVLQGMLLVVMSIGFPSCCHESPVEAAAAGQQVHTPSEGLRWRVAAFLAFTALRGFAVSSLESATAMILEADMSWELPSTCLLIGATFMACIPFKMLYDRLRAKEVSFCTIHRSFMFLAIAAACLWFTHSCLGIFGAGRAGLQCWQLLLVGDALFFPTLFLCSGITRGLLMNEVRPAGFFTRENVILLDLIFNTLGRSLGPPLARCLMTWGSRNTYALSQVTAIVLAWAFTDHAVIFGEKYATKGLPVRALSGGGSE